MKSSACTPRRATSSAVCQSVINPTQTSSQASPNFLKSKPSSELHGVISHAPNVMNSSTASLDDFSRVYVNLIRYFKAVWPTKDGKKSFRNGKKSRSEHRSTRALELQLKRQQEKVCYDWHRDTHNPWRVHRTIDPYGHIDSELDSSPQMVSGDANFPPAARFEEFHSPSMQRAK